MNLYHLLTMGSRRKPKGEKHVPIEDEHNPNLHYGACPTHKTHLRKKGKNAVCKVDGCNFKKRRVDLLGR